MLSESRICFVVPSLSEGGAERVVSVLASELAEQGYPVEVIIYYRCENEYPISDKVKLVSLTDGDEDDYHKIGFKARIKQIGEHIKAFGPDYTIPFLPHVGLHTFLACIGYKTKIIQTIRIAPNISPKSRPQRMIRNYMVRRSYKTLAQTEEQRLYFSKRVRKKVFVLPNPVYGGFFEEERIQHEKIRNIVSVGRLTEQKNFPLIIDAVIDLHSKYPDIRLDIYGDGELRDQLERYIREHGGSEYCHLRGRSSDLINVYGKCDAFVLPSDFEGMPNSLMEAMACAVPCISTDCETGPSDLIESGRNGILIPVGSKEKMIEALEWMIDRPQDAYAMGLKARETTAQQFSAKKIVEKLLLNLEDKR